GERGGGEKKRRPPAAVKWGAVSRGACRGTHWSIPAPPDTRRAPAAVARATARRPPSEPPSASYARRDARQVDPQDSEPFHSRAAATAPAAWPPWGSFSVQQPQ